jgi:hypothetical protein
MNQFPTRSQIECHSLQKTSNIYKFVLQKSNSSSRWWGWRITYLVPVVYLTSLCEIGLFWHKWVSECQKEPNVHTYELNRFFCTSSLKAPNRLKSLKLAWRFFLTNCDIYQNPFTQEKILKFWECRTKKWVFY